MARLGQEESLRILQEVSAKATIVNRDQQHLHQRLLLGGCRPQAPSSLLPGGDTQRGVGEAAAPRDLIMLRMTWSLVKHRATPEGFAAAHGSGVSASVTPSPQHG